MSGLNGEKEVAPLFPVPSCADKAAPAAACPRDEPISLADVCGVACATRSSRTVEVRSSPRGNQSPGSRTDAVWARNVAGLEMSLGTIKRRIAAAVVLICLAQTGQYTLTRLELRCDLHHAKVPNNAVTNALVPVAPSRSVHLVEASRI
jgi:hypothetical protein